MLHKLITIAKVKINLAEAWGMPALMLVIRLWLAQIFFNSGLLKFQGFGTAVMLFEYEYDLPIIPPVVAAYAATGAELVLSVLIAVGLAARPAAVGLFIMVLMIETLVYPGTQEHYYWMMLFALIAFYGPGRFSLDAYIRHRFMH
jgi:putative oxidoreductase